MMRSVFLVSAFVLAGCSDFPSFGGPPPKFGEWQSFPRIEPLEGLIIRAMAPTGADARTPQPLDGVDDSLAARIAALKARAAILRDAPVDDTTRAAISSP